MITIIEKPAYALRKGDVVGDAEHIFYTCLTDAVRASRAKGCHVTVEHEPNGGRGQQVWSDAGHPVPVRVEAKS